MDLKALTSREICTFPESKIQIKNAIVVLRDECKILRDE